MLCAAGLSALYSSQRAECCKAFGIECLGKINCFSTAQEKWTPEQRFECCRDHDRGCPAKCTKTACCQEKGVCSPEGLRAAGAWAPAAAAEGPRHTTLRLTVEGDPLEVSENPKKLLARVRRTLLKAGKALRRDPTQVVVNVLGVLMPGGTLPPAHRRADWTLRVPQAWNTELAAEEKALEFDDTSGPPTEADGEANAASAGQAPATLDGVYLVFSVAREADATEILAAVASGKLEAADGNAQTHAVGSDGAAVVRRGTVPPNSRAALTFVLAEALWLGGLVAFAVSRVRGQLQFADLSHTAEGSGGEANQRDRIEI